VFPFHRVAVAGNERRAWIYDIHIGAPDGPIGLQEGVWDRAQAGKVNYRLYDARHTFVPRLAENPAVSEETIRQLAGHVSPKMLSRYAHIRAQARRAAIATLEPAIEAAKSADLKGDGAQK
jgi:integrase